MSKSMCKLGLRPPSKPDHSGFGLVEVMVSILVLGMFTLTASSLMVYAAQNRVSARSDGEVTDELQQMMEEVQDRAATLLLPPPPLFPPLLTTEEAAIKDACSATTVANGFGKLLENNIPAADSTVDLNGRTYTVTRTLLAVDAAPFDRLQVTYTFAPQGSTQASDRITMQTEVIPNVAYTCP
jgi:prepilin-type N-terminal cleavage/methylation domain-containing protein